MALVQPIENGKVQMTEAAQKAEKEKAAKKNDLGYDQFLQLLCAEMQYQDPLEPTSNTEYVAQLATFSQMEATLAMQNTMESSNANALVGRYVIIKSTSASGEAYATEGFVDYVQKEGSEQKISVNGNLYSLADVYQVADPEYVEAKTLADAFAAAVSKLPEPEQLTLADLSDVKNLKTYFEGLNSFQQSYVDHDTLTRYTALVAQMEKLQGSSSDGENTEGTEGSESTDGTESTEGTQGTESAGGADDTQTETGAGTQDGTDKASKGV